MLTMNDKVHNLLIYRCFNQKWKNILEIFCIKIYSIIVFQNNGGVFKICNKSRIFLSVFHKTSTKRYKIFVHTRNNSKTVKNEFIFFSLKGPLNPLIKLFNLFAAIKCRFNLIFARLVEIS